MSSTKVVFDHYRTAYDVCRQHETMKRLVKIDMKPTEFFEGYRQVFMRQLNLTGTVDQLTLSSYRQAMEEFRWYRLGMPRYRVYPNMVLALSRISIDIDAGFLKLPFPTFTVELPQGFYQEHDDAPPLRGMLVHSRRRGEVNNDRFDYGIRYTDSGYNGRVHRSDTDGKLPDDDADVMIVNLDFGDETVTSPVSGVREQNACKPFAVFDIDPGKTISERFDLMPQRDPPDDGYMPGLEFQKACLRIAVGVAFFAVNNHKMVTKEIPDALAKKRERAQRRGDKRQIKRLNSQINSMGFGKTYGVGRELLVPSDPPIAGSDKTSESNEPGRSLKWSHIRSGHMAWQRYGPRSDPKYKLIFRPFTQVRPDLPLKPQNPHALR